MVISVWQPILKAALLLFLVVGVTVYVAAFIRKSRTMPSSPPDPNGYMAHFNQPSVPRPEWTNWTDDDIDADSNPDKRKRADP